MSVFNDLTDRRFGRLVVSYRVSNINGRTAWLCKCDCGSEKVVTGISLTSGRTKSCGCLRSEITSKRRFRDLTGERFGSLVVIKLSHMNTKGSAMWECRCDCGKLYLANSYLLLKGKVKSCGCLKSLSTHERCFKDLCGMRFNHLVALDYVIKNKRTYYTCICDCGNTCIVERSRLVRGQQSCGCLDVAHNGSKEELEIKEFISRVVGGEATKEKILNGKEIDIYYPSLNLGIEYNGSKFHATLGAAFENKHKLYHQDKFLLAKEKEIHLINIFDVDWANNQDKVKMYLRSLVVPQKRLFARKCEVKEISRELAVNFTDEYHIQGSVSRLMKINYGLFFNDELYAVMSFGKLRLSKTDDGQYELHRYCVKDGYTILGGAEKLLKHFEKDYSPKYIRSYSDNDYFKGGIYERLGFENAGQCTPRYYWFLNGVELRREACQLKRLKEDYPELLQEAYVKEAPNKEDYVMLKLGACKVYRSGNTKWEKRY